MMINETSQPRRPLGPVQFATWQQPPARLTAQSGDVQTYARHFVRVAGSLELLPDLEERAKLLERKQGQHNSHNGRIALADLYQSALDAYFFAVQHWMEVRDEDANDLVQYTLALVEGIRIEVERASDQNVQDLTA